MADTWWFEETKLLIASWSEEAVQQELNTMHDKKLELDKKSQEMGDRRYSRTVLIRCFCFWSAGSRFFSLRVIRTSV